MSERTRIEYGTHSQTGHRISAWEITSGGPAEIHDHDVAENSTLSHHATYEAAVEELHKVTG